MKGKPLLFVAGGVVVLAALFWWFERQAPVAPPESDPPGGSSAAAGPQPPTRFFEITVRGGKPVAGMDVLRVRQGEIVVLRFNSDAADELHLHGYDLRASLEPGVPTDLRFRADKTGRFEYELHRAHAELGVLEVHPR